MSPTLIFRSIGAVLIVLAIAPSIAYACPTCFAATAGHGLLAYYLSTILLSTMPFLMIGLIAVIAYSSTRSKKDS